MEEKLYVGFDRQEVTPEESIPLGGYGNEPKRYFTSITNPICVTCVAITDSAETTIALVSMDAVSVVPFLATEALARISEATGLPKEHIYLSATHTHSGAGMKVGDTLPCMGRFREKYCQKLIEVCLNALKDRKEATMATGSIETQNMNFVKHYKAADKVTGEICYVGDQFGDIKKVNLLDHATVADPTLHMVKFTREGDKPVVMANFRAHPHFDGGYKKYILSSDYIGPFRDALEAIADCHGVFFQGACGNLNSSTRFPSERRYTTSASYGLGLAGFAVECLEKYMTQVPVGPIRTTQEEIFGEIKRAPQELREKAELVLAAWEETLDQKKCKEVGAPFGIRSSYHAKAIKFHADFGPNEARMVLNAVAIGDHFAFATFPGEMFDSVGQRMEGNSPFKFTMMLGYCGHHVGYLPSSEAYKYTSYETDTTRYAPGTGEIVADKQVEMLRRLK